MPDLRKSRENSQFWPIGYNCYRIELKTLNLQIIMKKYAKNINTKRKNNYLCTEFEKSRARA